MAPACASGGTSGTSGTSGGSGHGCTDLANCCANLSDASKKSTCDQLKTAAGTNDSTCTSYYNAYKQYCP
jgi:hypothetical protein